jgi:hypothetical protein
MKNLLTVTAIIETGTGVSMMCCPSGTVLFLLGSQLENTTALTLTRVLAAAICALGLANWLARYDAHSTAARGLIMAMLLYNLCALFLLGAAGIGSKTVGIGLWTAVIVHAIMSAWCAKCLVRKPAKHART